MSLDKVLLIIPCYNEEFRLKRDNFLDPKYKDIKFLFVDDGSSDATRTVLSSWEKENNNVHTCFLKTNSGKGGAIRKAYLFAKQNKLIDNVDWVGYWDADLATPLYEVQNMLTFSESIYDQEQVNGIYGSRIYRLGSRIVRNPKRHYFGRCFATLVSIVLGVESYDSQCGAKLLRTQVCDLAFEEEFISKWIFDIEILLRLKENLIEYPLKEWVDVEGSKVKIFKELFKILKDIYSIWKKYIKN